MATSAFKSTTKRAPIGKTSTSGESSSSDKGGAHRRSRSLSRFSHRMPKPAPDFDDNPAPRGPFVNTVRGSGFPEISLDDLALEFFPSKDLNDEKENGDRGHLSRRLSEVGSWASDTASSSQRRGRSVSRQSRTGDGQGTFCNDSGGARAASVASSRRRSVSVVRSQISDSESSSDQASINSYGENRYMPSTQKQIAPSRRLRRSLSQKDLFKSHDDYSSHSSPLTDDETRNACSGKLGIEKTIRAVYTQKKAEHPIVDDINGGLHEAMRKEVRHAVKEIKKDLEQALVRKRSVIGNGGCVQVDNSDILEAFSAIRKKYSSKLGQSEKRKQDLLAEILSEGQQGRELSRIVRELLPDSKNCALVEKPSRARKRSNDRNKMSKRLSEEAEKYFEDFILNVKVTDISSFDGERSDTSSTLGGNTKIRHAMDNRDTEAHKTHAGSNSFPSEMDGVTLPWLQWETSNDGLPLLGENKKQTPVTPKTLLWDAASKDANTTPDPINHHTSSCGSWSPAFIGNYTTDVEEDQGNKFEDPEIQKSQFDMDEYLSVQNKDDLLFEMWRQRNRISSGGLLLCSNAL